MNEALSKNVEVVLPTTVSDANVFMRGNVQGTKIKRVVLSTRYERAVGSFILKIACTAHGPVLLETVYKKTMQKEIPSSTHLLDVKVATVPLLKIYLL